MTEMNFQCSDCGVCFQDTEEGAKLAKEHVELTGHNEDLIYTEIHQLLEDAFKSINKIPKLEIEKQ